MAAGRKKSLSQADKLQIENQKMEKRLEALRRMMEDDKKRREERGGTFWRAGREGPIHKHTKQVMRKLRAKNDTLTPRTYRVLRRPSEEEVRRKEEEDARDLRESKQRVQRIEEEVMGFVDDSVSMEEKKILDDVPMWTIPDGFSILQKDENETWVKTFSVPVADSTAGLCEEKGEKEEEERHTLLDGVFNEEDSHNSFLDALNEWRKGGGESERNHASSCHTKNFEIQTNSYHEVNDVKSVSQQITFSKNMKYIEKLLLKRFKNDPEEYAKPLKGIRSVHSDAAVTGDYVKFDPANALNLLSKDKQSSDSLKQYDTSQSKSVFQEEGNSKRKLTKKESRELFEKLKEQLTEETLRECIAEMNLEKNHPDSLEDEDSCNRSLPNDEDEDSLEDATEVMPANTFIQNNNPFVGSLQGHVNVRDSTNSLSSYTQNVGSLMSDFTDMERIVNAGDDHA